MKLGNSANEKWFVALVNTGLLQVKRSGSVFNVKTNRYIGATGSGGYPKISFQDPVTKRIRSVQIHRLVWTVYKGSIPSNRVLNHKDGIKTNSRLSNLELVTLSENACHAVKTGLVYIARGEEKPNACFSDAQVSRLRQKYALSNGRLSIKQGAKKFKVSTQTLTSMLAGRTYSHVETMYDNECRDLLLASNSTTMCKQEEIRKLRSQGKSSYEISVIAKVSRNTVMKYWK